MSDSPELTRVVYTSVETVPFGERDLEALLATSRRNNHESGLTGLLLYSAGRFMQVLEGPRSAVRPRLARIAADPRHTGVLTVLEQTDTERRFGDWAMSFRSLSGADLADVVGYNALLLDPAHRDVPWLDAGQVEALIDRFRDA